jgi:hypothetical protein
MHVLYALSFTPRNNRRERPMLRMSSPADIHSSKKTANERFIE